MISKFIRDQWESEGMETVNDERRQLLEEAVELDQIWGIWEGEEESTNEHHKWIRQPSQSLVLSAALFRGNGVIHRGQKPVSRR